MTIFERLILAGVDFQARNVKGDKPWQGWVCSAQHRWEIFRQADTVEAALTLCLDRLEHLIAYPPVMINGLLVDGVNVAKHRVSTPPPSTDALMAKLGL